jgi:hypothetical protein
MHLRNYFACIGRYINRVGIGITVFLNVLLGGHTNQSFSARNYEWKRNGKPNIVFVIDILFVYIGGGVVTVVNKILIYRDEVPLEYNFSEHCLRFWAFWQARKYFLLNEENILMEHEKARQIIEEIEEEQSYLREIAKQLQKDINSG